VSRFAGVGVFPEARPCVGPRSPRERQASRSTYRFRPRSSRSSQPEIRRRRRRTAPATLACVARLAKSTTRAGTPSGVMIFCHPGGSKAHEADGLPPPPPAEGPTGAFPLNAAAASPSLCAIRYVAPKLRPMPDPARQNELQRVRAALRPVIKVIGILLLIAIGVAGGILIYFLRLAGRVWGGS